MSSDKPYMARMQSMPRYYVSGLVRELSTKNVFLFAQAIAFKVLVTIVPILILLMGVLGDILGQQAPFDTVARFVRGFLPPYQSQQLLDFLSAFQGSSGAFLSVGTAGLLLTAMTLATTVRLAVASAFEQEWNEDRSLVRGYAFDLRMVVQVGSFFLLTVGLSLLAQAVTTEGIELMQGTGLEAELRAGRRGLAGVLSLVLPLLVSAVMFFQLFYFVPIPHPPKISAAIGAFVTAVLWELAKYSFAFYATSFGPFNYESAADGIAALAGGFGLVVAFVLWVYYSGIVLMIGAVVASLHEQRRRILKKGGQSVAPGNKLDAAARQHVGEDDGEEEAGADARDESVSAKSVRPGPEGVKPTFSEQPPEASSDDASPGGRTLVGVPLPEEPPAGDDDRAATDASSPAPAHEVSPERQAPGG